MTKLYASDAEERDEFGNALAIDDGILVVGAYRNDDQGNASGSAYLFDLNTHLEQHKLLPIDGSIADTFGYSVAIDGEYVAVSSPLYDDEQLSQGTVYIFDVITGEQVVRMVASDPGPSTDVGRSIGVSDGVIVAGAPGDDQEGNGAGAVYVFDLNCMADMNADFQHEYIDVLIFLTRYQTGSIAADFNSDGVLDYFDISQFLEAFWLACN